MTGPVSASDVVVGLLTENTKRMLVEAIRLVRSLRWFGGALANARVVVCGVGPLESRARATLEALGAEIRTVSRFHPANPAANRHQLIAELLDAPQDVLLVLDCDTMIVQDPLPYLSGDAFRGKITPTPTVTDDVFERLFAHFRLPKPPRSRITPFSETPTIPYFNAGVLAMPRTLARTLAPLWRKYNVLLADRPELAAPCQRHIHQASLALALAETGVPCVDLPMEMNFQINARHIAAPPGFAETDPVIIHYHQWATDDGFVLPCPYPAAQQRIDLFHERMRKEGFAPEAMTPVASESRPIAVLGMHRSGTSVVTELLTAMGVYAGGPNELAHADMFNPTGYWEHKEVVELDGEILDALGATWASTLHAADVSRLPVDRRAGYVARARRIVAQSLQGRGPFVIKDPRMSLLFPLWREALQNPVCVITSRDPMAVARSLQTRDNRPTLLSIAIWEHYMRTLLRETEGLSRVVVPYEELIAEPVRVTRALHDALVGFGIEGLRLPSDESIGQIVNADFNRSGRSAKTDETLLNGDQCALLADLNSGAALRRPEAPTAAHTFELFALYAELDALRGELADRDELFKAVFESRPWRLGYRLTGALRFLRRSNAISAMDRWRAMKRRGN